MRYRLFICLSLILLIAACQGPPPTQIVLVVTATSETQQTQPTLTTVEVQQATELPTTVPATPTAQATPTFDPFPTPTVSQIQVAEQVFEHGRMMWIQPRKQIWVMVD